ncbi:ketopantoate reductase family protein [Rhizobium hidalgonense]|uniref:2-dehydropantoate 2-reductase n=1 Tax=Rhizobium hidalgonense TaxID=1538159 RepID=A0ABX4JHQ4_9HYPH|nr:2-dehydropantoate 2-reductase [Rhizobium hidalgonense]EJC73004.1 ketopantoate reductase [Rhizobium leguminosarum bv. trifolii WSM2012]MDR9815006.1 2-dehydropantoate 2-reductase [Rhizobium hidalgonense]PDT19588.1 2-dehydropantoate 2-reductase [Rhizobium hidalgonense]PON05472.1 2-dehydropantoate 2-reductase [Rhizobium hidalgonense]RWX17434.1 2-dehydropantoate 2-reductase [Rhizobium hidalgonense]
MPIKTISIYGAGALGGAIAAKLARRAGNDTTISVVARGAHLDAIRRHGLSLREADAETPLNVRLTATDDPTTLPPQDLVITGLKGHQLAAAAEGIAGLLRQGTRVVMILNGIPWWYFHRDTNSRHAELQFDELDPGGRIWRLIGPERAIGCVAYQGAEVVNPGEIQLSHKGRFVLGEPSGEMSADLEAIAAVLTGADLNITTTPEIRSEIWSKLMGNAAFNPISALTRALMTDILADPALMDMVSKVMKEVRAVGDALGAHFSMTVEQRLEQSRHIGGVRTSMLQDLMGGKPLEITPLVGMLVALGRLTAVPTPVSETILALVTQLDRENRRGS